MSLIVGWAYACFVLYSIASNLLERFFPNRGLIGPAPHWCLFAPEPFSSDYMIMVQERRTGEWIWVREIFSPPIGCRNRVGTLSVSQAQLMLDALRESDSPPKRNELCGRFFLAKLLFQDATGFAVLSRAGLHEGEPELLYKAPLVD